MTPLTISPQPLPLRQDSNGDVRIGETRVLLDLVIRAWQDGDTPETILQNYPALKLADVYAVIAYYLTHQEPVEAYLRQREEEADAIQRKIEAAQPGRPELWERLLALARQPEKPHAPLPE